AAAAMSASLRNATYCVQALTLPPRMPQPTAVMQARVPDSSVTPPFPHPATRTMVSKPSFFMSGLLFGVIRAPLVELLEDGVDAAHRVANLVLGYVVVGLKRQTFFVEERRRILVVDVLRRGFAFVGRLAKAFELAVEPGPEIAERLVED